MEADLLRTCLDRTELSKPRSVNPPFWIILSEAFKEWVRAFRDSNVLMYVFVRMNQICSLTNERTYCMIPSERDLQNCVESNKFRTEQRWSPSASSTN